MNNQLRFPRSVNAKVWRSYLGRKLSANEYNILSTLRTEMYFNKYLNLLHQYCDQNNMYVSCLPEMDGDCLFNSLLEYNIGESVKSIRTGLATFIYLLQHYKNFIPNTNLTLEQMFSVSNDIEYVGITDPNTYEKQFFKYSFPVMSQDLSNNNSWSKLPTELILRVLSLLYKIRIHIVHPETAWINVINSYESCDVKPEMMDVYLGLLGETHYVPILPKEEGFEYKQLVYSDAKEDFWAWATDMEKLKSEILI